MPNNNKMDVVTFRQRLKNGEYETIAGANRGIGKMKSWTDKEKQLAKAAAARHFGLAEEASDKPVKKAAKKAAKKVTRKSAKKVATPVDGAEKKSGRRGPKRTPHVAATAKEGQKRTYKAKSITSSEVEASIENTRNAVQAYAEAVDVLKKCQGGEASVELGLSKAAAGVTKLIEAMDLNIVQPLSGIPTEAEKLGAELFRKAAPSAITPDSSGTGLVRVRSARSASPAALPVVPPTVPVIPPTS